MGFLRKLIRGELGAYFNNFNLGVAQNGCVLETLMTFFLTKNKGGMPYHVANLSRVGRRLLFVVCMILVFKGIPSHGLLGD